MKSNLSGRAPKSAASSPPLARKKKIVVDISGEMFKQTEAVTRELGTTTSDVVRKALHNYLAERSRTKLEQELEAGYLANAETCRSVNDEWAVADAEIA